MSILYLDFERYNDTKNNIKSEAILNFSTSIKQNNYSKIALTKLDIDVNNLFCMHVPLLEPQEYKDNTSYIKNYDMVDSNGDYIFNQDNGWFETIFSFVLCYKDGNNNFVSEEFPFLYKSEETDFNYNSIGKRETTTGFYEYDNFNEYFVCSTPFNFLNSLNVSLKYAISDRLGITDKQIKELMPNFTTDNTRLIINNFSYGNNNDMQPDNNDILQVQYPEEVDDGNYEGHTTPGPMFCFGINKEARDLLYHSLVNKKYSKDNPIFPSPGLTQEYYFLKLDQLLETSLTIPSVSAPTTKYNITAQYQEEAYDSLLDIKTIVIKSQNIPMPPLFQNKKTKDFLLSNNNNSNVNYYSQDTLFKLCPNWNSLYPRRLIFNNNAITNNFSALYGLNQQQYSLNVEFIDKYNNSYEATLGSGQKLYAQIAVFN